MDELFTEEWDAMPGMRVRLLVGADEAARLHAVGKDDYPVGDAMHPTQKPVDLIRYLVRTYSSRGGGHRSLRGERHHGRGVRVGGTAFYRK